MTDDDFPDGSWSVHSLPNSHWHCQLSNFEWEGVRPRNLRAVVRNFLLSAQEGASPHLLMTGEPGLGKTHLGVALYRQLARDHGTQLTSWVNVPAFCARIKASYGQPGNGDPFSDYEDARRLVVLDDLLGRDYTQHETEHIIYRLIDTAYMNDAAVVITMNHRIDDLPKYFRAHEVSRLLADITHVQMSGRDRRISG